MKKDIIFFWWKDIIFLVTQDIKADFNTLITPFISNYIARNDFYECFVISKNIKSVYSPTK